MNGLDIVTSTTEPAFAVTLRGRLLAWNSGAERLFGLKASQVVGRRCWEVLAGRDIYGNDHCQNHCRLRRMARSGRPVSPFEVVFLDAVGEPLRARVSLLSQGHPKSPDVILVHLLCPCAAQVDGDPVISWRACASKTKYRLTVREREVLALLAEGKSTQAIAEGLGLSPSTVRNHVHNILHKLRVHSRLEAVALGRRLGLIC